jgi:N-acetylglucosaminyl-diphospho-decaprenol L-rhamnosyltransferase
MALRPSSPRLSSDQARVDVVVVNYRTSDLTKRCLAFLESEKRLLPHLQVVVVDGGSNDGSAEELAIAVADPRYQQWVSVLPLQVNGGFGWANNQAISSLLQRSNPPEFIHLLNPDTEIEEGAVAHLLSYLKKHARVGAVSSQLLELDGSLTGSAFTFPTLRGEFCRGARTGLFDRILNVPPISIAATVAREVDWVTGASVMFRTEALKEVGLFDEGIFLYHEEIELMWRLRRAGWAIAFEPLSRVRHVGGAATGVHSRQTLAKISPRKPSYWYRSRSRLFALTRGRMVALLAYLIWIIGYTVWAVRRITGLTKGAKPVAHQFRDHVSFARPRRSDVIPAAPAWDERPRPVPTWMEWGFRDG